MGFAAGSEPAHHIAQAIQRWVGDDEIRMRLYDAVIKAFEEIDCDTLDEVVDCYGFEDPQWDAAMRANGYVDEEKGPLTIDEFTGFEERLISLIQAVDPAKAPSTGLLGLTQEQYETLEIVRGLDASE